VESMGRSFLSRSSRSRLVWRRGREAPQSAPDNPLSNATFTRLTNFEGDEAEAALSPDGKFATFLPIAMAPSMCG